MSTLLVKKCFNGILPTRGSSQAIGYDLYSAEDVVIPTRSRSKIETGIAISLPEGVYGRIAPRSGLAAKHGLDVGAGVIDRDYFGTLKVIIFNHDMKDYSVKKGDRIAQLILERAEMLEIKEVDELDKSDRGSGGFGSTG